MSKWKVFLLVINLVVTFIFVSCTNKDETDNGSNNLITKAENNIEIVENSNFEKINNYYKLESKEEVYLRKIEDNKYLVGYRSLSSELSHSVFKLYDSFVPDLPLTWSLCLHGLSPLRHA